MAVHKIPFGQPLLDQNEIDAVTTVLSGPILAHGSVCLKFEKAFAKRVGVKHAISVSSGTAGLHLSLFANAIGPGDEVIVPAMTHVATAHAVEYCSAKPVFVDVDPKSGNIDPDYIDGVMTNKTRSIMAVHFLGLPCDMDRINAQAKEKDVFVIEDAALAVDAKYGTKKAGALGKVGCFSFYPIKHMTSIEGGMVTTNDESLARSIRQRKAFGYDHNHQTRKKPGIYDVPVLGYNYRMNEVEAAVGLCQLEKLDDRLKIRHDNYNALKNALSEIDEITVFDPIQGKAQSSYYCLNAIFPKNGVLDRDAIASELNAKNIGTSVHYPGPVPMMTYYQEKYNYKPGQFPIAEWIANQTISLPVAPHVPDGFEIQITAAMKEAIYKTRNLN
jgi:dTDP-4-amino-4,6-dideoxygalactose transaminase